MASQYGYLPPPPNLQVPMSYDQINTSSSSYSSRNDDDSSDDEALPPEDHYHPGMGNPDYDWALPPPPDEEMQSLEEELAALEREEQYLKQQEEQLSQPGSPMLRLSSHMDSTTSSSGNSFILEDDNPPRRNAGGLRMTELQKALSYESLSELNNTALRNLSTHIKSTLNDPEFSDIVLVVEGKKIHCHKVILASRAEYFKKIFETNRAAKEIALKDLKYPVCMGLLEYVYSGQTSVHKDWCEELYQFAGSNELPELQRMCEQRLDGSPGSSRSMSMARANSVSQNGGVDMSYLASETTKMRETRKKIATEIVATERTYVNALQLIYDRVVVALRTQATEKNMVLTTDEVNIVFPYWEVLLKCHNNFLKVLEERMKIWDEKPQIGDIFIEKIAFIKLYKHYVNNYDKAFISYKQFKERTPKFQQFLSKLEYTPILHGQGIPSFLILPVQRIPRYVLLLQDLLKHTTEGHPDLESLHAALKNMKELADYIDTNKNDADEINKVLAIQERLVNWPTGQSLVKPRRRLLREGVLYKNKDKKLQVFLFTDALLYCTSKSKDKLKYKGLILLPTSTININPKSGSEKYHFEIIAQTGKLQFTALPEEKDAWIKLISDTIESSQKDLLNTAFAGFEKNESEGSKQFQKLREEENLRRRSELALQIRDSERDYLKMLEQVIQLFYEPLQESTKTSYAILPQEDINNIFCNIGQIYRTHSSFFQMVEKRVDTWEEKATLGDLFLELTVDIFKLYDKYIDNISHSTETLERIMSNNLGFASFVVTREKEHKTSLTELLEKPLKRLPWYYLALEELMQYTAEDHPDAEKLKPVITRIKENLQQQKNQKIKTKMATSPSLVRRPSASNMSSRTASSSKMAIKNTSAVSSNASLRKSGFSVSPGTSPTGSVRLRSGSVEETRSLPKFK